MVLDIQSATKYEILRDLAEGLQRTELYASNGDLAAATDLLLENILDENALVGSFWDCFFELGVQAEAADARDLAAWLREIQDWCWSLSRFVDPQLMSEVEEE